MNENEYQCYRCGDVWDFFPEDYDFVEEDYPEICPLCSMSVWQMIHDVFAEEGFLGVIKQLYKRIF